MHGVLTRGNQLLSFGLTVMAFTTALVAMDSVLLHSYTTDVSIKTGRVKVRKIDGRGRDPDWTEPIDLGTVSFDMKVNFTNVFNWNVKQLFVYLTAEYPSAEFAFNQQVIWDKIISRDDNPVVDLKEIASKYYFWDAAELSRSYENVNLSLSWNVIPESGFIVDITSPTKHIFKFPKEYEKFRK